MSGRFPAYVELAPSCRALMECFTKHWETEGPLKRERKGIGEKPLFVTYTDKSDKSDKFFIASLFVSYSLTLPVGARGNAWRASPSCGEPWFSRCSTKKPVRNREKLSLPLFALLLIRKMLPLFTSFKPDLSPLSSLSSFFPNLVSWKLPRVELHRMDVREFRLQTCKSWRSSCHERQSTSCQVFSHQTASDDCPCVHEFIPPSWIFVFMALWGNLKRLKQTFWWDTQHVTYCCFQGIFYIIRRDFHLQNLGLNMM